MKIAVIGLGYWGPNLVRNFLSGTGVTGIICCDLIPARLERVKQQFPMVETSLSYDEVLARSDVAAVVLATPVSTHFPLGMKALQNGKHLLVEKPLTLTTREAVDLHEFAEQAKLVLMVDHTFVYTSAVRKIKEYIDRGEIGDILYFDSVRVNLGLFQHDTNVVWDLAPHDLSIMEYLLGQDPISVSAVGVNHFNGHEDVAYITVNFQKNLIAHFHVNWLSPVKVRRILIGGTKLMVVYDDMEPSEKVKIYDRGVDIKSQDSVYHVLVEYRTGNMFAPHVDQREALGLVVKDFLNSIRTSVKPVSDGHAGVNVVRILEAANASLKHGGQLITFAGNGYRSNKDQLSIFNVQSPKSKIIPGAH